jgi:conjugative relaxase-like TrwC/TraI family protein
MVVDVAKLSAGREDYYVCEIAGSHEEYLSGHGESPGRWYGGGSAALDQRGEASTEAFQRIFEGRHPTTGELLGRAHGKRAVPAFDLVFRPTKSVALLYALGDPQTSRAVLDGHHAGLAEAVAYLDGHLGGRRGHGGAEHVCGGGVLAVGFDHRTSREGDPLPHTHLVAANRVQGPDGRWTALDGRDVYRHRRAADAIYRAAYQRHLTRTLGVEWTAADRWGNREIQGVPEALIRAFSKRTEHIEAEVKRLEADGRERTPRLVKWAVHATRKAKEHEAPETLHGRWRGEAAELGTDADTLVRQVTGRVRDRTPALSDQTVQALFARLAGPQGLTAQASTFARQDVIVALGAGLAGATRQELEALADRFCAERAVSVVADRALEERRWSTPELLGVEQRLVAAAEGRTREQTGVVSHESVRAALAAYPSVEPSGEQAGLVRDVCLDGAGVRVVVGRPGTGKTYTLGVARHAFQLGGYRVSAAAPTGIATLSLEAEGFEEVATVDRLLVDLDRDQRHAGRVRPDRQGDRPLLDARTVLVVDEAGMVGSRKLARLLDHAETAGAKVVLVGDDRQLAAIDAGGGFRALRVRLGASELVENRRQLHAWQREAIELVRQGQVEEAVELYRAHDRVVAADSKPALTLALLNDWWAAWQEVERDPVRDVVVLAARRDEVDRLNTQCQQLLATRGRLGPDRLKVEDREVAVGDRVVCGRNALGQLGVANGTRGLVTALDPAARTLTIRTDGLQGREVTLPRWYLDGRQPNERNRRVDLAYATTGHRAQGLTKWRALVRVTGTEDGNWFTVQLSRAKEDTRLYAVVGPEPQGAAELDLPARDPGDACEQLARGLSRPGGETLAIDTHSSLDVGRLSTGELRAERDRLRGLLAQAPRDRGRELERATARREQAEQALAAARQPLADRQPPHMLRWGRGGERAATQAGAAAVAEQQANRAVDREQELRGHQQQRAGWCEANAPLGPAYRQVVRQLAWQQRATGLAHEAIDADRPGYLREALGPVPESTRGKRAWHHAAAQVEEYRAAYQLTDPDRALGPQPRAPAQRGDWQQARAAVERVAHKQRVAERGRDSQPTREQPPTRGRQSSPTRAQPQRPTPAGRPGPERAAG